MEIPNEIVERVLNEVVERFLKPKFISLGMNASGDWLNALEVRGSEIWGMDYTEYLVRGRSGGTRPPIAPLIRWVGQKFGLSGQEAISTAYAVATKIEIEGTNYYPNGTDLLEVLESREVKEFVMRELSQYVIKEVNQTFVRQAKQILA